MEQDSRTEKYQQMRELLNEKQWRQFLALEAKERGNIVLVAREAGVSKNTFKAGRREMEAGELFSPGKQQGNLSQTRDNLIPYLREFSGDKACLMMSLMTEV